MTRDRNEYNRYNGWRTAETALEIATKEGAVDVDAVKRRLRMVSLNSIRHALDTLVVEGYLRPSGNSLDEYVYTGKDFSKENFHMKPGRVLSAQTARQMDSDNMRHSILIALEDNGPMTCNDIAVKTGYSSEAIRKCLRRLCANGEISCEDNRKVHKRNVYRLKEGDGFEW